MTYIDCLAVEGRRERVFIYYAVQLCWMALFQGTLIDGLVESAVFTLLCLFVEWCMNALAKDSSVFLPFFVALFAALRAMRALYKR